MRLINEGSEVSESVEHACLILARKGIAARPRPPVLYHPGGRWIKRSRNRVDRSWHWCLPLMPEPFADAEHDAVGVRDAEFKARSNPPCTCDEVRRGCRRTDFSRGLFEQLQPAIEVIGIDRQWHVFGHRRAVIAAGHQHDRRPES